MCIGISDLTKRYGPVTAVDRLSMRIDPSEIVVLLGTNGAGKTTTIDCLVGVRRPTTGTISYEGRSVAGLREVLPDGIGFLPEMLEGYSSLTIAQNVGYFAGLYGRSSHVGAALEQLNLTDLANRKYGKCSRGERVKANLACTLVSDPKVLVLDEPTIGLDPAGRHLIWDVLRASRDAGKLILFSTHYLDEAEALGDRVVIMKRGRCVAQGPVSTIVDEYSEAGRLEVRGLHAEDEQRLAECLPRHEIVHRGSQTLITVPSERGIGEVISTIESGGIRCAGIHWQRKNLESAFLCLTSDEQVANHAA